MRFLDAQPSLRVADLDAAVARYEILGFRAGFRGEGHQVLHGDQVTIHLSTNEGHPAVCQIRVHDVDAALARATAAGFAVLFDGLADRPWGCRDVTVRDPDGNQITLSQPLDATPPRLVRPAAYGLIHDAGRILLCRIAAHADRPGFWTLPGGGLDFGEDPETGMTREVAEETGLEVEPVAVAGIDSLTAVAPDGTEVHSIRMLYHVRVVGGALRDEVGGSTDHCEWWPIDSPPSRLVELAEVGIALARDAR